MLTEQEIRKAECEKAIVRVLTLWESTWRMRSLVTQGEIDDVIRVIRGESVDQILANPSGL
jgi:hypothetical protein